MVNTPLISTEPSSDETWNELEKEVRRKLITKGLLPESATLKWMRSPKDLATLYPGSRGAIYGSSSNNRFAAFTRPANTLPGSNGIFLASGSAHPGGGMPMAMISGKHAAKACHHFLKERS